MTTDAAPDSASRAPAPVAGVIVAEPDPGYRWKHLIMSVLMIAGGCWFAYDGWVKWPNENRKVHQLQVEKEKATSDADRERLAKDLQQSSTHSAMDILFQKVLAFSLPTAGLAYGIWTWQSTRGRYRLEGQTLHVPGHPEVAFEDVRRIDKRKWERKGVAYVYYEKGTNPPKPGVLRLDDFAYERKATDDILALIEEHVQPAASKVAAVSNPSTST